MASIETLVRERILILDGAMGTMIQQYNLTEEDFRGKRFAQIPGQLKGNNDILCLTRLEIIFSSTLMAFFQQVNDLICDSLGILCFVCLNSDRIKFIRPYNQIIHG